MGVRITLEVALACAPKYLETTHGMEGDVGANMMGVILPCHDRDVFSEFGGTCLCNNHKYPVSD